MHFVREAFMYLGLEAKTTSTDLGRPFLTCKYHRLYQRKLMAVNGDLATAVMPNFSKASVASYPRGMKFP